MSADLLHQAADLLRKRAEKATPGPWREEYSKPSGPCVLDAESRNALDSVARTMHFRAHSDASYIATVHPGVGLALAEWLLIESHHVASHDCEAHCPPEGCDEVHAALEVARLIVGGES